MRSLPLDLTRTAATLLLGLFAGGVLFVVLAPSLSRLPGPAYARYWQALNTDYARAMPPLLLTCVALLVATVALSLRRGAVVSGILATVALVLVVAIIVLTVTRFEPLNQLADTWDPDALPAEWEAGRATWWRLHAVRTVLAVVAFAALLAAAVADRGTSQAAPTADDRDAGGVTERLESRASS